MRTVMNDILMLETVSHTLNSNAAVYAADVVSPRECTSDVHTEVLPRECATLDLRIRVGHSHRCFAHALFCALTFFARPLRIALYGRYAKRRSRVA